MHNVRGRKASGDLTIRPWSSTELDLGMKTVLLAAKQGGSLPPSCGRLYASK